MNPKHANTCLSLALPVLSHPPILMSSPHLLSLLLATQPAKILFRLQYQMPSSLWQCSSVSPGLNSSLPLYVPGTLTLTECALYLCFCLPNKVREMSHLSLYYKMPQIKKTLNKCLLKSNKAKLTVVLFCFIIETSSTATLNKFCCHHIQFPISSN